jgi:Flp pilus assembly pilin Flp
MWPGNLRRVFKLQSLASQDEGQDLVEYSLLIALVGAGVVASTRAMAIVLTTSFTKLASAFVKIVS